LFYRIIIDNSNKDKKPKIKIFQETIFSCEEQIITAKVIGDHHCVIILQKSIYILKFYPDAGSIMKEFTTAFDDSLKIRMADCYRANFYLLIFGLYEEIR